MTRVGSCGLALAFGLGALLWALAMTSLLPQGSWPAWPFNPATMGLDQILVTYGMIPRALVALIAGACLGLAGALLQAVLRNPIADPTTLGISGGAQLALVLATVFAPNLMDQGRWPVAIAGAGLAAATVMAIGARRAFAPVTMVIAGMLVAMTASAIATAITLARGEYIFSLVIWNGGSLVQQDFSAVKALGLVLVIGAALSALLARPLRILSIGAEGARGLGMNVTMVRFAVVVVAVILSGSVAAELGMIGFVGLAAPALARSMGARNLMQVIARAPIIGAAILFFCDALVMTIAGQGGDVFPTGAVTGLIGGPLLIWLLPRLRGSTPPGTEAAEGRPRRLKRPLAVLAALLVGMITLGVILVLIGRVPGGWAVLDWQSFLSFGPLRLPRLVAAAAAGVLLAMAGAMMQRMTANPLASPEVLGVSGGASIGYAVALYVFAAPSQPVLISATMLGALVAMVLVAAYARRSDLPPERVLLAGIAVSAMAASILSAIMATGSTQGWQIMAWLAGSSGRVGPVEAAILAALALIVGAMGWAIRRWLAILPLGAGVSGGLGLPMARGRLGLIALAGIATGAATVLVGPLSFVGLMAPHLARSIGLARASDHLLGAALIGAILMVAADFGARMAGFPYELPLGLFASLLGAPWLIWLMMRTR